LVGTVKSTGVVARPTSLCHQVLLLRFASADHSCQFLRCAGFSGHERLGPRMPLKEALLRQAQLIQQIDIARIAVPLIQRANDFYRLQPAGFFRERLVQPGKGLLLIAESGV
jgi:hypothetical protein